MLVPTNERLTAGTFGVPSNATVGSRQGPPVSTRLPPSVDGVALSRRQAVGGVTVQELDVSVQEPVAQATRQLCSSVSVVKLRAVNPHVNNFTATFSPANQHILAVSTPILQSSRSWNLKQNTV